MVTPLRWIPFDNGYGQSGNVSGKSGNACEKNGNGNGYGKQEPGKAAPVLRLVKK